jgi:hypothetical protein
MLRRARYGVHLLAEAAAMGWAIPETGSGLWPNRDTEAPTV